MLVHSLHVCERHAREIIILGKRLSPSHPRTHIGDGRTKSGEALFDHAGRLGPLNAPATAKEDRLDALAMAVA